MRLVVGHSHRIDREQPRHGHAPQPAITASRSSMLTRPSPPGGAMSDEHRTFGVGQGPQAPITASRSSMFTTPVLFTSATQQLFMVSVALALVVAVPPHIGVATHA